MKKKKNIWLQEHKKIISSSPQKTMRLGKELANVLLADKREEHALVIALEGDLGSGKTTFIQGFAKEAGITLPVLSPTFVVVKSFDIPGKGNYTRLYHIDCYRIDSPRDLQELEWESIVGNPTHLILIEWPSRVRALLPQDTIWLQFRHEGKKKREILFIEK